MPVIDCLKTRVTPEMNSKFLLAIDHEEVLIGVKQMHPEKAPGPDGFIACFFQKYWHLIGKDVVSLVQQFFTSGSFPFQINNTNVVLIPKKIKTEVTL